MFGRRGCRSRAVRRATRESPPPVGAPRSDSREGLHHRGSHSDQNLPSILTPGLQDGDRKVSLVDLMIAQRQRDLYEDYEDGSSSPRGKASMLDILPDADDQDDGEGDEKKKPKKKPTKPGGKGGMGKKRPPPPNTQTKAPSGGGVGSQNYKKHF